MNDKFLTHSSTLEKANKIRNHLLHYKPHPCVYVYQTDYKDQEKGYDVHVSNEFGMFPSDEFFSKMEEHIKDLVEEQPEIEESVDSEKVDKSLS